MDKQESKKPQDVKNQNLSSKKFNFSANSKSKKDKSLPWWVELLFVQIGLPDRFLIKILKVKKNSKEIIKNEKKFIFILVFISLAMAYFYPVIKNSKNKSDCEATAKSYIMKNKNLKNINNKELRMLSTNLCNGGKEIYEFENYN